MFFNLKHNVNHALNERYVKLACIWCGNYKRCMKRMDTCNFSNFQIAGRGFAAASEVAVREWLHIYDVVSPGSHQFCQYWTGKTVFILVRTLCGYMSYVSCQLTAHSLQLRDVVVAADVLKEYAIFMYNVTLFEFELGQLSPFHISWPQSIEFICYWDLMS